MAGDDLDDQLDYVFDSAPDSETDLETDLGTHVGTDSGTHVGTDSGTHVGTHVGTHSATDMGPGMEIDLQQSDTDQVAQSQDTQIKDDENPGNSKPSKRSQKKKNQAKKDEKRANMEAMVDKKRQLGRRDPATIADYIASKLANKDLSALEIQDQSVAQSSIVDSSEWQGDRVLSRLPTFVKNFDILDGDGIAVVLNISAIRACDACRALRSLKVPVGKLIPKNKPKQDQDLLAKNPKLVVATPGRIRRLINDQILEPSTVAKVIVETSFIDPKANSVFDLPETVEVLHSLTQSGAKLYIY